MLGLSYLDPKTGKHLWRCPQCGELIRLGSQLAVCKAEQVGSCKGCRLAVACDFQVVERPALHQLHHDKEQPPSDRS